RGAPRLRASDGLRQDVEEGVQRLVGDVERRHEVEGVAERPDLRAELERVRRDLPPLLAEVAALAEVDGRDHAEAARAQDARERGDLLDAPRERLGLGLGPLEDAFLAIDGEDLARDGGAE